MDDLIVIILTLVFAVAGVLGQMKKKKKFAGDEGQQEASDSILDMFKEELGINDETQPQYYEDPVEVPVKQEVKEKKVEKVSSVDYSRYQFRSENEGTSEISQEAPKVEKREKISTGIRKDFTLRKAVIYSEILNRKYD